MKYLSMKINEKGQCPVCKKKPLIYKTTSRTGEPPHKYCTRCNRSFDIETGEQKANWAWVETEDGFFEKTRLGSVTK